MHRLRDYSASQLAPLTNLIKALRGCSVAVLVTLAAFRPSQADGQTTISVPDPNLQSAINWMLGKTNGLLTTTDMLGLTKLTSWASITNLTALEYATNLTSLQLYAARPISLSPLLGLSDLRTLALERTSSERAPELSNLTQLTNLDLFFSSLTNVNFLKPLTNLVYLDVSWNRISDPGVVAGLPHLAYLDVSGNPLTNCSVLTGLTNFSGSLYLDSISLTNIDWLASLKGLTQLSLYQNPVIDLGALSLLTNLIVLDLGYAPVLDLSPLSGLTNLESLYLEGTAVSNLDELPLLPRLTKLDVNDDRLASLNALTRFTRLQWLNASYNHLTNIDALTNLSQLATVYLQVNSLDTNSGAASLSAIEALLNKGATVYYIPQHGPPVISLSENWIIPESEPSSLPLWVSDDLTSAERLVLRAQSSNTSLVSVVVSPTPLSPFAAAESQEIAAPYVMVPNPPVIRAWNGYLSLFPVPNQTGTATITITATDETGLTTSALLALTVSPPLPFDGTAVAGSNTNLIWSTFGAHPWQAETNLVHSGTMAVQSGSPDSWLQATVNGPGLLTFWWRYFETNFSGGSAQLTATCPQSGLTGHARLSFPFQSDSGVVDWQIMKLSLPSGAWLLRWQASQPALNSSPTIWLADVSFTPGLAVCWLEPAAPVPGWSSLVLKFHGQPGETYDLQGSLDLRQWTRLDRLTLSDFEAWFLGSNATNTTRFYRMSKPTLAPIWFESPSLNANNLVQLTLHSESGQPLAVESSTNLLFWETLVQTNNPADRIQIAGRSALDSNVRFYRAKALPWPGLLYGTPVPGAPFPINFRRHSLFPPPLPQLGF